jgi:hypothetical protein
MGTKRVLRHGWLVIIVAYETVSPSLKYNIKAQSFVECSPPMLGYITKMKETTLLICVRLNVSSQSEIIFCSIVLME